MFNFKQYLIEGRDAPLYHGTTYEIATEILHDNFFGDYTTHFIKDPVNPKKGQVKIDGVRKRIDGISLSRSFNFSKGHGLEIVFELDQRKLSQRYKIIPVNYLNNDDNIYDKYSRARLPERSKSKKYLANEYEEFVVGKVKPAENYITKIHAEEHVFYDSYLQSKKYAILLNHPKLFIDGKFINVR